MLNGDYPSHLTYKEIGLYIYLVVCIRLRFIDALALRDSQRYSSKNRFNTYDKTHIGVLPNSSV